MALSALVALTRVSRHESLNSAAISTPRDPTSPFRATRPAGHTAIVLAPALRDDDFLAELVLVRPADKVDPRSALRFYHPDPRLLPLLAPLRNIQSRDLSLRPPLGNFATILNDILTDVFVSGSWVSPSVHCGKFHSVRPFDYIRPVLGDTPIGRISMCFKLYIIYKPALGASRNLYRKSLARIPALARRTTINRNWCSLRPPLDNWKSRCFSVACSQSRQATLSAGELRHVVPLLAATALGFCEERQARHIKLSKRGFDCTRASESILPDHSRLRICSTRTDFLAVVVAFLSKGGAYGGAHMSWCRIPYLFVRERLDPENHHEGHHESLSQPRDAVEVCVGALPAALHNQRHRQWNGTGGLGRGKKDGLRVSAERSKHHRSKMSASSSDIVIFFIDIAEQPLARLLSTIARDLARLEEDLFSVYLVTDVDDSGHCSISSMVEAITLKAVIKLLDDYMDRIDELLIEAEYLSSLGGVWALVDSFSPSVGNRTRMYYTTNDL
ncbi:hypothetical protein FA13DRAFT_1844591 [Coprinellus micaceus]|uniref:Uncharacterized protein n=1 Tax=Coprinellus micaceus TaxID=71717 RepID=A0A4Y7TCR7_COPMI|nr:hypothetical protein FA13DRAFT_1844591 [Coprinellus micaceus]